MSVVAEKEKNANVGGRLRSLRRSRLWAELQGAKGRKVGKSQQPHRHGVGLWRPDGVPVLTKGVGRVSFWHPNVFGVGRRHPPRIITPCGQRESTA